MSQCLYTEEYTVYLQALENTVDGHMYILCYFPVSITPLVIANMDILLPIISGGTLHNIGVYTSGALGPWRDHDKGELADP